MRRLFANPVPLPKAERKRLHKLQARYDALCDKYPDGDMSTDDAAKLARKRRLSRSFARRNTRSAILPLPEPS